VDMKEVLTDNILLRSQLDALHSQPAVQLPAAVRSHLREVGSPLVCFLAYGDSVHFRPGNLQPPYIRQAAHT